MIEAFRGAAKSVTERVLLGMGAAVRARRRHRRSVAILAYHNVVPRAVAGRGDASLHVPFDAFRRQLDRLEETHRIVGLGDLSDVGALPGDPEPRAVLTFDDGYRGVLRHAVPELVARGLPATVFVCPGLLDAEGFWWDRVADTDAGPGPERRRKALRDLGGRQEAVLSAFGGTPVPEDYRPAGGEELRAVARRPGITLASHTWSHPDLTAAGDEELREELTRSREWLEREVAPAFLRDHLTFPYGRWDDRVAAAAREAGYRWFYRVEGGPADGGGEGGVLPRINVPAGVSVAGFELRCAGVLP